MIQRVVRNGRVRAFGAEWELDELSMMNLPGDRTVGVREGVFIGDYVTIWNRSAGRSVRIGYATRCRVAESEKP